MTHPLRARLSVQKLEARTVPATVTVTGTGDTVAVDGIVTLREALVSANANANVNADVVAVGAFGLDTIAFNIPGAGVRTIAPTSALPTITDPVVIDGYTQSGSSPNTNGPGLGTNAVLLVELNGSGAGEVNGLDIAAGGSTVRGLAINRFQQAGILLRSDGNVVAGNFLGTSAAGDADLGNTGEGVRIQDGLNNTVGGLTPADRNVISGNNFNGVYVVAFGNVNLPAVSGNVVLGNLIGTNAAGTAPLGNGGFGAGAGVLFESAFGRAISNNVVGGTTAAARNVISGNPGAGNGNVVLAGVSGNRVQGNYIGTDVTGNVALLSTHVESGVALLNGSNDNLIGGDDDDDGALDGLVGARNVISGNPGNGIMIFNTANGAAPAGNRVQGNFIGTNAAGTAAVPNQNRGGFAGGVVITGPGNTVGGAAPGAGNLISGNAVFGVLIRNGDGNAVQGNRIGTDVTGTNPIPNGNNGVNLFGDFPNAPDNNRIGGTAPGEGNVIAFNQRAGVAMSSGTGNAILGNSIFGNVSGLSILGLGIDLGGGDVAGDGVTVNDAGDADTGGNNKQNFPVLSDANTAGTTTTVTGTLQSTANTTFRLEFFSSPAADPTGFGEGQTFLGFADRTTDASGTVTFSVTLPVPVPPGHVMTATATDPVGNTSEFSEVRTAESGNQPPTDVALSNTTVPENQPAGAVVGTFSTTDPDTGDTHTYALVSGPGDADNAMFTIAGDELRTAAAFDLEVRSTYSVRVASTDSGAQAVEKSFSITITNINEPPTADAGGPYTAFLGSSITLDARGSTDPDAGDTIVHYDWDLDNDGQFDDATGARPTVSAGQLAALGAGTHPIAVRVEDSSGLADTDNTTLQIGPRPGIHVSDVQLVEGHFGTRFAEFTISLVGGSAGPVTVTVATAQGTAAAGSDYFSHTQTLTFRPGGPTSQVVQVRVVGDRRVERDETFFLNVLSARGAAVADRQGMGTIVNDDGVVVALRGASFGPDGPEPVKPGWQWLMSRRVR